jgi:hypothetical protein
VKLKYQEWKDVSLKIKKVPSPEKSKASGFNFNCCEIGKLARFEYYLLDDNENYLDPSRLKCVLTSVEDEEIEELNKEEIENGIAFSFKPSKELNETWYNYILYINEEEFVRQENVLIGTSKKVESEAQKIKKRIEAIILKMQDKGSMGIEKLQDDKVERQKSKLKDYELLLSDN